MDVSTMMRTAAVLLLMTAGGGVAMALLRGVKKINPPSWLAMVHGLLAASGLTLLIYAAAAGGLPGQAMAGSAILLAAAAGGVVMNLVYHLRDKLLPHWLLLLHTALAAVGTGMVAWSAWGG